MSNYLLPPNYVAIALEIIIFKWLIQSVLATNEWEEVCALIISWQLQEGQCRLL